MTTTAAVPADRAVADFRSLHHRLADAVEVAIHGKRSVVELVLTSLFAGGHVLLEDVPGTGKTTLARALATALGAQSRRVQFTPDLLPSDVTGTSVYDPRTSEIAFREGPVFSHVVLADEINRAAAKTQSALLEVMEERTVTVDGVSHAVPAPFLVIATQNPVDLDGTYRLPEAQLDRFLIRVALGYPQPDHELEVLRPASTAGAVGDVPCVTTPAEVARSSTMLATLHVADPILGYVREIGEATRADPRLRLGASTRGLRALVRAAQANAGAQGRGYVVPSDVLRLAGPVLAHRLVLHRQARLDGVGGEQIVQDALHHVEPPRPGADA